MTCYNRWRVTVSCLATLFASVEQSPDVNLRVILVDDNSPDNTGQHVLDRYPAVDVVRGKGDLFWGGGMRAAYARACELHREHWDYALWLNDDVDLFPSAITTLLEVSKSNPGAIVVGPTQSSLGTLTYSGMVRVGKSPTMLRRVWPEGRCVRVDTFNGNVVLVPRQSYRLIGDLDPAFRHLYADTDYGLRASRIGVPILMAPVPLGVCERNTVVDGWLDASLSVVQRWRELIAPKGLSPRTHFHYLSNHMSRIPSMLYFAASYSRILARLIVPGDESV